jgi:hypothetical protein
MENGGLEDGVGLGLLVLGIAAFQFLGALIGF